MGFQRNYMSDHIKIQIPFRLATLSLELQWLNVLIMIAYIAMATIKVGDVTATTVILNLSLSEYVTEVTKFVWALSDALVPYKAGTVCTLSGAFHRCALTTFVIIMIQSCFQSFPVP